MLRPTPLLLYRSLPDSRGDLLGQTSPGQKSALPMATHGAFPWDQGNQEGDSEKWHLCFRAFSWEGPDPVQNLRRLLELCRRWLRPDLLSKEEMVELVALEQLMISAPEDVQVQVRESGVRSCRDLEELLRGHGRPVQPVSGATARPGTGY